MIGMTERRLEIILAAEKWRHVGELNGIPIAATWLDPRGTSICFCPYCSTLHFHGIVDGPPETEHRIEHCSHLIKQGKGYYLKMIPGPIPDEVLKAAKCWESIWRQRSRRTHGTMTADELLEKELKTYEAKI